jgi:hypothetical protein
MREAAVNLIITGMSDRDESDVGLRVLEGRVSYATLAAVMMFVPTLNTNGLCAEVVASKCLRAPS